MPFQLPSVPSSPFTPSANAHLCQSSWERKRVHSLPSGSEETTRLCVQFLSPKNLTMS